MHQRTKESISRVDSPVPLMHHDPRDLGLICAIKKYKIRFRILSDLRIQSWIFFLKKRTPRKVRNTAQSTKMADDIFNRPVQKEGSLPRFLFHTVCNFDFYHSSELKVIFKQERFVYFSAI